MSTLAPYRRTGVRIRRIASLTLSIVSIVIASANTLIFVVRPSTFLSDGTFGLWWLPAFFVDSLSFLPIGAIAGVILAGTLPAPTVPPTRRIDRLAKRIPMILAITACCLVVACFVLPAATILLSLLVGILRFGL